MHWPDEEKVWWRKYRLPLESNETQGDLEPKFGICFHAQETANYLDSTIYIIERFVLFDSLENGAIESIFPMSTQLGFFFSKFCHCHGHMNH